MKLEKRLLRKITDSNFTWGDLNKKYTNLEMLVGLTFCPFHENRNTPSAKFYYDNDRRIYVLHCFSEHKHFDVYDYLNLILCEQKQLYKSPTSFLIEKLGQGELLRQYRLFEQEDVEIIENNFKKKVEWINNVYDETGNVIDYIERLYMA